MPKFASETDEMNGEINKGIDERVKKDLQEFYKFDIEDFKNVKRDTSYMYYLKTKDKTYFVKTRFTELSITDF